MSDANLSNLFFRREAAFAEAVPTHSSAILTLTGQPIDAESITIGGVVYTFKTTLFAAPDHSVIIGRDARESLINLAACINADPGNGTRYVLTTLVPDANVIAEVDDFPAQTLVITTIGSPGLSTAIAETLTNGSWSGSNTAGGSIPTGTVIRLRFNKESLIAGKDTVESEEIRSDRSLGEIVQVGIGASGGFESELISTDLDDFLLSALMVAAWTSATDTHTLTVDAAGQTLTTSTTFGAAIRAAKFIKISGLTNPGNNGIKRVINNSATVLTLEAGSIVANQGSTAGIGLLYRYARNGTVLNTYLLEKEMLASKTWAIYRGMSLDVLTITAAARAKVMAALSFLGYDGDRRFGQVGSVVTAPSTNPVITSSNNIGFINLDDIGVISPVTNLSFEIKNNLRNRFVVASPGTLAPGKGTSAMSGKMDCYFDNSRTFKYFLGHRRKSLHWYFKDANNAVTSFHCPKIRFPEGNPNVPGLNQDIILPLAFRALKDPDDATGYQLQIDALS